MRKSFQFKLFHNPKKYKKLDNELYIFCSIYNHCLALIKRHYKFFGKNPTKFTLQKHLKRLIDSSFKPSWKTLGYSQGVQDITDRIYKSYEEFFKWSKKRCGVKKSPPKFKAFRKYKSFTLKQKVGWKIKQVKEQEIDQKKNSVKIGKNWYRFNYSRDIEGEVKTVTVKRDNVGYWYIIFSCDLGEGYRPKKVAPMTGKSAGFDFGLSCFLTSSDNDKMNSPEFLKGSIKQLRLKSKELSRKKTGSSNRAKARKVLARLHQKISNQRQDFHFKMANKLIHKYDYLFFEDLNLDSMKRLWGRKVSDLGLYSLIQRIEFKAKEHGKIMHKIDRFYPSSKTCSSCSTVKQNLALSDRLFICDCGNNLDRDLNAAINILTVGASTVGLDSVTQELALASVV